MQGCRADRASGASWKNIEGFETPRFSHLQTLVPINAADQGLDSLLMVFLCLEALGGYSSHHGGTRISREGGPRLTLTRTRYNDGTTGYHKKDDVLAPFGRTNKDCSTNGGFGFGRGEGRLCMTVLVFSLTSPYPYLRLEHRYQWARLPGGLRPLPSETRRTRIPGRELTNPTLTRTRTKHRTEPPRR